ncbi:MAG: DUF2848 family protein [Chloroflexi bacterium]|nr:DUF2848 family protein [Chloroflexota bacterium]
MQLRLNGALLEADSDEILLVGYTGRDRAAVLAHIEELEKELGAAPPPRVPMIYTVPGSLVTTASAITVNCPETSGEAEVYLVQSPDHGLLVGVGSDHTDRKAEAEDIPRSKGLCQKVLSPEVWRYDDVAARWDDLELRSWVTVNGDRRPYQQGRMAELLAPPALLDEVRQAGYTDLTRKLIFGGTLALIGGFAYAERFEAELRDPATNRAMRVDYAVRLA